MFDRGNLIINLFLGGGGAEGGGGGRSGRGYIFYVYPYNSDFRYFHIKPHRPLDFEFLRFGCNLISLFACDDTCELSTTSESRAKMRLLNEP